VNYNTYRGSTPTGGPDNLVVAEIVIGSGNATGLDDTAEDDVARGADNSDIIVVGAAVVVGVVDDGSSSIDDTAAVSVGGSYTGLPSGGSIATGNINSNRKFTFIM
jgi:hypothetical protein